MIHTKCSDCCFFQENKCFANQWIEDGQEPFARGYCHLKRTFAWSQQYPQLNAKALLALVKRELSLKFDLLVLFDENVFTYDDLHKTINTLGWKDEFCINTIIADTTGNKNRPNNISRQFLAKNTGNNSTLLVDQSVDKENSVRTIDRIYKKFDSRYFLVLTAGQIVDNLDALNMSLTTNIGRAVHWRFPIKANDTYVDFINPIIGLYHRMGFHLLHRRCVENCLESQPCKCPTFVQTLSQDSEKIGFNLSFLFNESVIY
jgi:hypothetical protein